LGFIKNFIDFFKRIGIFTLGIFLIPIGAFIAYIGSTSEKGMMPVSEPNPLFVFVGIIVIIIGLTMMGFALKSRE
jgi:hypothetical protein